VLKKMFTGKEEEQKTVFEVSGINPETLRTVIAYIYYDKIEDAAVNVDVLAAADMYRLNGLFSMCEDR
jgi:hypothetical protein